MEVIICGKSRQCNRQTHSRTHGQNCDTALVHQPCSKNRRLWLRVETISCYVFGTGALGLQNTRMAGPRTKKMPKEKTDCYYYYYSKCDKVISETSCTTCINVLCICLRFSSMSA